MTAIGKTWRIRYTWQGITWRVVGSALFLVLWIIGLFQDFWVLAGLGLGGLLIFLVSWLVAATFDVQQKDVR